MHKRWAFLAVMGCAPADDDVVDDPAAEAARRGPHAVGYLQSAVTYRPVGHDADRTIPVEVWYPADPDGDALDDGYALGGLVQIPTEDVLDAPDAEDGVFPVAVYSHGSGGVGIVGYPFAERLASHGWIVLAPDHVGNTSLDLVFGTEASFERSTLVRPLDVQAVLDAVEADAVAPALAGRGDVDPSFVFGHSFGGYTTLAIGGAAIDVPRLQAFCSTDCALLDDPAVQATLRSGLGDPRVKAIAPQAPALFGLMEEASLTAIEVPVLLQSAAGDITTPDASEAEPMWAALDGADDRWLHLLDGGHYSFITVCDIVDIGLIDAFAPGALEDGCGPDFTPTLETIPALATWLVAYAGRHALGEARWQAVLDGPPPHPEAEVLVR